METPQSMQNWQSKHSLNKNAPLGYKANQSGCDWGWYVMFSLQVSLDVSWCPRITDAALEYIACDLTHLEELTLDRFFPYHHHQLHHEDQKSRCVHISDIGVGYISTMLALSSLFLRWFFQTFSTIITITSITFPPHHHDPLSLPGGALRSGTLAFSTFAAWETFTFSQLPVKSSFSLSS